MFTTVQMGTFWIVIAAITLVIEIITLGLSTIWFTGGAIVSAVAAYLGAGPITQIVLFIVVSTVLLLSIRPFAKKRLRIGETRTNIDSLIDRKENILETVDNSAKTGRIKIGDVDWRAVSEDGSVIPEGTLVRIVRIEGTKLYVKRELD